MINLRWANWVRDRLRLRLWGGGKQIALFHLGMLGATTDAKWGEAEGERKKEAAEFFAKRREKEKNRWPKSIFFLLGAARPTAHFLWRKMSTGRAEVGEGKTVGHSYKRREERGSLGDTVSLGFDNHTQRK